MKAAVLKAFGTPLSVETVPDPTCGTGEVIVDVVATRVLSYAHEVLSGARGYLLTLPVIPGPGGIGRVRAIGPDATQLAVGDWVYCDPTIRARDDAVAPDIVLQGLTAGSERALRLLDYFGHGSWAGQMRLPTENAVPIGTIDEDEAANWSSIGSMLVPYGGFLAANLQAGETVVVNGATGSFGSAAVVVALAMGAGRVIATGRNAATLRELVRRFGDRVRTVQMQGNDEDRARMIDAAAGPVDCVLDILPPAADPLWVSRAIGTLRPGGRAVLMGGLRTELRLPYTWLMRNGITVRGQWMYPRDAIPRMVALVRSGRVPIDQQDMTVFDLDHINEAIAHAAAHAGPFAKTVIRP